MSYSARHRRVRPSEKCLSSSESPVFRNVAPIPYTIDTDNGFFRSLKEANSDPLSQLYEEGAQRLSQVRAQYSLEPPFPTDDTRLAKLEQERSEAKKLLESNLKKITMPSGRPHYGPGLTVPNSVLVRASEVFRCA